jgi:hypothetical protein
MREHEINKLNNFVGGWYFDDTSICDKLIQYHQNSNKKAEGTLGRRVNKNYKDSTDVMIEDKDLYNEYVNNNLQKVIDEYRKKYIFSDLNSSWDIIEWINIQHYAPGGQAFKVWHTERSGPITLDRHLVFMTYLNDITDQGETEFYYQKIKVKPEKGLTLIWGSDWTFTHRGIPSMTQDKYIATGWYNFLQPKENS